MLEAVVAQLRFAYSLTTGRPFHIPSLERLLRATLDTRREFGFLGQDAHEFLNGPPLDIEAIRDVQLRRLRTLLRWALEETSYYPEVLAGLALDPRRLTWEQWPSVPLTIKTTLRDQPEAFVRSTQAVTGLFMTTGTTGVPTTVTVSEAELTASQLLTGFALMLQGELGQDDVIQVSTTSRSLLANTSSMGGFRRLGALVYQTGIIDPAQALAMLGHSYDRPGKKARPSVLLTFPSYLARLVETGLRQGLTPADFDVRFIPIGGEILTEGLKRRAQKLFGPVTFYEGYGLTEAWSITSTVCEQGHLHFEPSRGLMEVIDPDTGQPAAPGAVGTLVLTCFPPYRVSSVVLRYDTQDLVRQLVETPTCSLRSQPASSNLLGKLAYAVRHVAGWTTPRDILEAIESIDALPLPARCGLLADESERARVTVEVVAPEALREEISAALEARGVPLGTLVLVDDPRQLRRPFLWRGDLHESSFSDPTPSLYIA